MTTQRTLRKPSRRTFVAMAGSALAGFSGCGHRTAKVALPSGPRIHGLESLRAAGTAKGLLVGCAVSGKVLAEDAGYAALVREQANIVVSENDMKWEHLRPTITTYDFQAADALVAFAEKNRMKVRGHNLCWHRQLPKWFAAEANPVNARQLLTEHIQAVAGRYAGRMHSWDVVNEAVWVQDGRPDGLRESPWLKLIGEEYIEVAFRTARLADPQALLTYNDFGCEEDGPDGDAKRAAVVELLRRLKARNVPLDAVGVQAHVSAGPKHVYGAGMQRFLREVKELGLQVFVTEMDVNDRDLPGEVAARDAAVAGVYGGFLDLMLRDPHVTAVLTWGITDRYTWLNSEGARKDGLKERCLPFDGELQPVEAFFAIRESVQKRLSPGGAPARRAVTS